MENHFRGDRPTLYQVSTSAALVQGVSQGAIRVGAIPEHGDFGLGTFEDLDGEMIILDGLVFQLRGDGSVRQPDANVLGAFVAMTRFVANAETKVERSPDLTTLLSHFDPLRRSDNLFYALRAEGVFDHIHARAVCKSPEGASLLHAASTEAQFEFHDISGTLVGFWTPEYAKTLNIPGYHLHFLSSDRAHGGHLIECAGSNLDLQVQQISDFYVTLPTNKDFLDADLRRDPSADLAKAEGVQK